MSVSLGILNISFVTAIIPHAAPCVIQVATPLGLLAVGFETAARLGLAPHPSEMSPEPPAPTAAMAAAAQRTLPSSPLRAKRQQRCGPTGSLQNVCWCEFCLC